MPPRREIDHDDDSSDDEESYEPSIPVPVFGPAIPPTIRSISHETLVNWERRQREDEAKMKARCSDYGENYDLVTQSIKGSFDADLHEAFFILRLRKEVDDVTEEKVIAQTQTLLVKVNNDDLVDIKALFQKELEMDLKETDVDARVLTYFQRFKKVVKENGFEEIFHGADGEKEMCKRLVSCLAPPVLKADVKIAVR
ncbi:hypothetical protein PC123_g24409 [Phytophthora cactorum]|nr:hypothetical protein PC123_g24409 [Phytophthora cactorum]